MKKTGLIIVFTIVALGILAAVLHLRKGDEDFQPEADQPLAVRIQSPRLEDLEIGVSYLGTLGSRREVKIIARVPGTLIDLPFGEGQTAEEGMLLAEISAPEISAQIERLQADRDYWARRHEADRRLMEKSAISQDQALTGERNLGTTEAALKEALSQREKTRERAPFPGSVLAWLAEPGQSLMPGQPLLHFGSLSREVLVQVAEEDLRRGLGRGTEAVLDAGDGEGFSAQVSEVSPAAGGASRTFTVKIALPDRAFSQIPVGSSLRVTFIIDSRKGALTLPTGAVRGQNSDWHIFLVRDGRAFRQPVRRGIESRGRVAVDFPWNGIDKAVISNPAGLADGAAVFAVDAEEDLP